MRVRTEYKDGHPAIIVSYDDTTNFLDQHYCGDSWCTGTCGLSALTLVYKDIEYKTHSDMVACGPVFKPFRVTWIGKKDFVPPLAGEVENLIKMMWW